MSRPNEPRTRTEWQPLSGYDMDQGQDTNNHNNEGEVSASLIGGDMNKGSHSYTVVDPVFQSSVENPYQDTTESDRDLRRIPCADLVPRPWQSFFQVLVMSYISIAFFIFTGIFAVKYCRRGHMHQTKGLWGMAQKDFKRAVMFIYISLVLGIFFWIILPVIVICKNGC